jgi:hypothetical protein
MGPKPLVNISGPPGRELCKSLLLNDTVSLPILAEKYTNFGIDEVDVDGECSELTTIKPSPGAESCSHKPT